MLKKLTEKREGSGFTLIELLVSMAIIAVLVSVVIVAILAARLQQRNHQRRTFASNIKTAMEAYYANQRQYPTSGGTTVSAYSNTNTTLRTALQSYWSGTWPTEDSLVQNNRVVWCSGGAASGLGSGRYVLLVNPETGITGQNNPAMPACSQANASTAPAGWETYSN